MAVWDAETGERLRELTGHQGGVSVRGVQPGRATRSPPGSEDETVAVWDAESGQRLRELTGHQGGVSVRGVQPGRAAARLRVL